jgi:hypothetical protein
VGPKQAAPLVHDSKAAGKANRGDGSGSGSGGGGGRLAEGKANRATGVDSLRGRRRPGRYPVAGAMHMTRRGLGPGC